MIRLSIQYLIQLKNWLYETPEEVVAFACGVHPAYVADAERGDEIPIAEAELICLALGRREGGNTE